jgi:hypothetical protein
MRKVNVFDGNGVVVDESHTTTIAMWTRGVIDGKIRR